MRNLQGLNLSAPFNIECIYRTPFLDSTEKPTLFEDSREVRPKAAAAIPPKPSSLSEVDSPETTCAHLFVGFTRDLDL